MIRPQYCNHSVLKETFAMRAFWPVFICLILSNFQPVFGQDTLKVAPVPGVDSTQVSIKESDWPNPRKAAMWAIIPGGGQVYNRRWWKLPFVYGAFAGMGYLIDYNQSRYKRLRTALDLKRKGLEHEFTGTSLDDASTLRILRDQYDKRTQLSYIGTVLVYGLQAMEAFTDAHLRTFDISDDLSLQMRPSLEYQSVSGIPAPGVAVRLTLRTGR